jgi:fructokinase
MRIGIDLGGTKTEIIALDDDGSILLRRRVATPSGDYAATVECIAVLVETAEAEVGQSGTVGVAMPGAELPQNGLIKNANSTWLIGRPLRADLSLRLGREVRLANDANCFALSEAHDGAAAGAATVFGVILGTGVGGGLVVNGSVLQGANAIAGEWGHNYLPQRLPSAEEGAGSASPLRDAISNQEPHCYCGRRGCIETYLSGPGMVADHVRVTGQNLTAESLTARAATGDAACEATLQRYEARLAFALAQVINVFDPEVIVLGGGLSNLERLYANVPHLWGRHVFSDVVATRLLRNAHGDSSGVRGAARRGCGLLLAWPMRANSGCVNVRVPVKSDLGVCGPTSSGVDHAHTDVFQSVDMAEHDVAGRDRADIFRCACVDEIARKELVITRQIGNLFGH